MRGDIVNVGGRFLLSYRKDRLNLKEKVNASFSDLSLIY